MQVKIFKNRADYYTKEINHASELNQMEIAGFLLRVHYLNDAVNYYNFSVDFTPEHIFKRTIERFTEMKKECIRLLQMTVSEHYSPRDMTPETDWSNQPIIKIPFNFDTTIEDVKHQIFIMSQNLALAKKVNIFNEQQIGQMDNERQEVLNFIDIFTPMINSIYPGANINIDFNENNARIENTMSELVNKNIQFEIVALRQILQEISSLSTDIELFGPRFEVYSRNLYEKQIEQVNSLIAIVDFLDKQEDKRLNFFDFYFGSFIGKVLKLIGFNKFLYKFKSFEQYFDYRKSDIINNKSIYDSNEKVQSRLRELETNKQTIKETFLRDSKRKNEEVIEISNIIQDWCDTFNSAFSKKQAQNVIKFVDMSDCKIASLSNEHFVALALKDPDGMTYQYRGVVLPEKHLEHFKTQNQTMSAYLLNDLDILNKNPESIMSTSFHNIDNILEEINRGMLKDFIFKNADENVLFTA